MYGSAHNGKIRKLLAAGFAICCLLPPPLLAAPAPGKVTVTLNPATTSIQWTLQDVIHTVHGTFTLKSGEIHLDPITGTADGLITIDAKSGESGSSARDERMQKIVLESGQFPEVNFRPRQVLGNLDFTEDQSIAVDGIFRLHGQDHFLQLNLRVSPEGGNRIHITTQFVVPYVRWGLKDPSTFILRVGKTVVIDVSGTATVVP